MALLLGIINAQGQTILEKINAIKSQNEVYLWNEYTHPDADTAVINAAKWVLDEINCDRSNKLLLRDILPLVKNIKMNRGSLTRAFVYIKRTDVPQTGTPTTVNIEQAPASQPVQPVREFVPDIFVQKIMQQHTFTYVYRFLADQKRQGQILQFGALKDVDDYRSFDLILFDLQSQEVVSVLSQETPTGSRINLTNGTTDSLDNYPEEMMAVIWYIK